MSATIEITSNTQARLLGVTAQTADAIKEKFSVDVPGAKFSRQFQTGYWDGKRHFFNIKTGYFPRGLVFRMKRSLRQEGYKKVEIVDRRRRREPAYDLARIKPDMLKGITMRDYQIEATKAVLEAKVGIVKISTNGGKTAVAAGAVAAFVDAPSVLFLVHKKVLLRQAKRDLAKYLGLLEEHIGEVGSGVNQPRRITVALVQSLDKHLWRPAVQKFLAQVDIVIGDECHHYKSTGMFLKVLNAVDAPYRIFLSGTPFPDECSKMAVESACGQVVFEITNDQLINLGVSAKPTVRMVPYKSDHRTTEYLEWYALYKTMVVENPDRNAAIVEQTAMEAQAGKQVLILVQHKYHGDLICVGLEHEGVKHAFLHAKLPVQHIEAKREEFEAKKISVIVATPIFDEGVNVGGIQVLVVADGGKSFRSLLQKVGRALRRKTEGENVVTIIDFSDEGHALLAKHTLRRIEIYENEGFEIVMDADEELTATS